MPADAPVLDAPTLPADVAADVAVAAGVASAKDRTFAFWTESKHYREFGQSAQTPPLAETPHRRHLPALLDGRRRIVDLACGDGNNLPHLPAGVDYVGLDCSPLALARLASRDDHPRLAKRGLVGDCENLPLPEASVEVVLSTFAFEHFTDVPRVLAEADRVLTPGGRLILIGPDFAFPNNFGPPQHARLLGRRLPLLAYAADRYVKTTLARFGGRERFEYIDPLPLDDATYIPDADMTHLTSHAAIARHLARRGYTPLVHVPSTKPPRGVKAIAAGLGVWGQNGDVLLAMQKCPSVELTVSS